MKIIRQGTVTFTGGPVKIEGWNIQRTPEDPEDATNEQLLLTYAIAWAEEQFKIARTNATVLLVRKLIKAQLEKQKAAQENAVRDSAQQESV